MGCSSSKVKSEIKSSAKEAVNNNKNKENEKGSSDKKSNLNKNIDEAKKAVENKLNSNKKEDPEKKENHNNQKDQENNQDQEREDADGEWDSNKNKMNKDVQDQVNRFESKISSKSNEVKKDENLPGNTLDPKPQIVFCVSAPGTNKLDVVFSKLKDLHFHQISVKNLLKERSSVGGSNEDIIKEHLNNKTFVPGDVVVDILSEYIDGQFKLGHSRFLIGGFPRCEDNSKSWKRKVGEKYNVVALVFFSYTRKEYEIEMEEKKQETGEETAFEEMMKKYDDYLMNTKEVDDDFGTKKMIKFSAKVADETLAEEIYNHNLFNRFR